MCAFVFYANKSIMSIDQWGSLLGYAIEKGTRKKDELGAILG